MERVTSVITGKRSINDHAGQMRAHDSSFGTDPRKSRITGKREIRKGSHRSFTPLRSVQDDNYIVNNYK